MSPLTPPTTAAETPLWKEQLWLFTCIFVACLIGIFARPFGYISAFWPANALMVGLLIHRPRTAQRASTWVYGWLAFVAADLITQSSWFVTLSLNLANVFGVFMAWLYLRRFPPSVLSFNRQRSVLVMFNAGLVSAITSSVGAWPASIAFDAPLLRTFLLWSTTEFYNFVLIVPLFMAAPQGWRHAWRNSRQPLSMQLVLPFLALLFSECMSLLIGGPGAIAFIMPAMVWCAMVYGVFRMALLNLVVCICKTAAVALGAFSFTPDHLMEVMSYRVGLALLSLAPLAVACAYALRLQTLHKLHHAVNHDFLTGVLGRRALMERGQKMLTRLEEEGQSVAVLMLDLDHFKSVNDRYGHNQGDVVLQEFAALAQHLLRPDDLLGRMGGEEFAILLPRTSRDHAFHVAQRLCDAVREHHFPLAQHSHMHVTLSVGLHAVTSISTEDTMELLLDKADEALYKAKNSGRNQVQRYGPSLAPSAI